ncbi:hypothetical protein N665_0075s0009 [Sinapis alba]|nr:hypothetical protein N665_0075s0009 [Sinapis alba]
MLRLASSPLFASASSCLRLLVLQASASNHLSLNRICLRLHIWFVITTISAASSSSSVISAPPPLHLLLPSS